MHMTATRPTPSPQHPATPLATINPADIVIRPALTDDAEFIYNTVSACIPRRSITLDAVRTAIVMRPHIVLVASAVVSRTPIGSRGRTSADFESVGCLCATVVDRLKPYEHRLDLNFIAVLPQFRRNTVGTRLLRRACQRVVAREIHGRVSEHNLIAQQFLRACGFSTNIAEKSPSLNGEPASEAVGDVYLFRAEDSDTVERAVAYRCGRFDKVPMLDERG